MKPYAFNRRNNKPIKKFGMYIFRILLPINLLAVFALFSVTANSEQLFSPPQQHFQYSGRIDFQVPQAPSISWPGSSVTTTFTGKVLSIILDDQYGKNYFNVFIDNDFDHPIIIDCKPGKHTYLVTNSLSDSSHTVTIFKRTEGEEGRTKFLGLILANGEKLLAAPEKPIRKIEFFGDSITSGMGNEAKEGEPDHILSEKNNFLAYGAITARNLNAEYISTSQSGIGIMVSWFDFIMPQFYDQLDAVGNNDTQWDFNQWQPDVVVVNLFQNDSWLIDREKRLLPEPNENQIVQAYINFLAKIRHVYPQTYIVAALGSMDATHKDSPWPTYIQTAVRKYKKNHKDNDIDTLFFMFDGFGQHPRVKHHQKNAEILTQFIKNKMHW